MVVACDGTSLNAELSGPLTTSLSLQNSQVSYAQKPDAEHPRYSIDSRIKCETGVVVRRPSDGQASCAACSEMHLPCSLIAAVYGWPQANSQADSLLASAARCKIPRE